MKYFLLSLFTTVQLLGQPVSYPLHIGDIWQYRNAAIMTPDTFTYSYKALSDTLISGQTYTVTYFNKNAVALQRQTGDSVYLYKQGFNKEVLYFDFSRADGDTVSTTALGNDTMDVVLTHTGVANYFGSSRRTWTFYVNASRQTIDDEFSVTVADSIGIVYNHPDFGDPMSLVGAVINGVKYGIVLGVPKFPPAQPTVFGLEQNFPNPFNPSTTITFVLPHASRVAFEVYNIIGQIVHREYQPAISAGWHQYRFVASGLASGVYYYQIRTEFGNATGKMLLLK